ncbi:MAG: hypothetical protein PHV25_00965, partial [Candidatus Pacebacteria bacterium]|nr:hypothetical protein [Candidatus Paceibacterota bacterium]
MKIKKKINRKPADYITPLIFFFMFFILTLLIVSNIRLYHKRVSIEEYLGGKKEELILLEQEAKTSLNVDPSEEAFNIEKMAREQLLLKKPGEEVVIIKYPDTEEEKDAEEE